MPLSRHSVLIGVLQALKLQTMFMLFIFALRLLLGCYTEDMNNSDALIIYWIWTGEVVTFDSVPQFCVKVN